MFHENEINETGVKTPSFNCDLCDFNTCNKKDYRRHTETKKHLEAFKKSNENHCKICHFVTCDLIEYKKHFLTDEHNETIMKYYETDIHSNHTYNCECGIVCKSRTTLWRHKKSKCIKTNPNYPNTTITTTMFLDVMKQNQEFQKLLVEQNKQIIELSKANVNASVNTVAKPTTVTNNITNNYSSNKTINNNNKFNLNMFLNEQCKDALNISDFVNSLQISFSDLENMGTLGFVEGISKIFVNRLHP
jgi:hypothetical protein